MVKSLLNLISALYPTPFLKKEKRDPKMKPTGCQLDVTESNEGGYCVCVWLFFFMRRMQQSWLHERSFTTSCEISEISVCLLEQMQ